MARVLEMRVLKSRRSTVDAIRLPSSCAAMLEICHSSQVSIRGPPGTIHGLPLARQTPLSSVNRASHARSRERNNLLPNSDFTSVSMCPSNRSAFCSSMQSEGAILSIIPAGLSVAEGITILFSDKSRAIFKAADRYEHVSSSIAHVLPGCIHGMFIIYASTISIERYPPKIISLDRNLQWL